jgi:hypothetical protein
MDPNANLAAQLRMARRITEGVSGRDYDIADVDRLAELVLALNEWIARGGFLPAAWTGRVTQ